jgi:hypothetical protein
MAKAERLAQQLDSLELEYRGILGKALKDCSAGRWGLFGHNEHTGSVTPPPELDELRSLARTIDRVRARIGEGPFQLHQDFEAARGRAGQNDPGEPKQAELWLRHLGSA